LDEATLVRWFEPIEAHTTVTFTATSYGRTVAYDDGAGATDETEN
jgi:hypothetical protein